MQADLDALKTAPQAAHPTPAQPEQELNTAEALAKYTKHLDGCLWRTPMPTGVGNWHCTCGLDSLVLDGELLSHAPTPAQPVNQVLLEALERIRDMTNADDSESYMADDREGCLDAVFDAADAAIAQAQTAQPEDDAERQARDIAHAHALFSNLKLQGEHSALMAAFSSLWPSAFSHGFQSAKRIYNAQTDHIPDAGEKVQPLSPDMFWNDDDAERNHNSIDQFLNDEICNGMPVEVGTEFTFRCALSLPKIKIRVTSVDEESCEAEYEVIEAAHGIKP
jgi:hypothetical protein